MPGVCGIDDQWVIDGKCGKVGTICCGNVKGNRQWLKQAAQCVGAQECDATAAQ